jgi:hypothetical protein
MRHIAHAESLFAGSLSTRANVAGAVGISPRHSWRALRSTHDGELVSVTIIPNERGTPQARVPMRRWSSHSMPARSAASRWSGVPSGNVAMGEKRDVSRPAVSVNGVTRNVLRLRSSHRALEAQEPLRQSILDAYSRLEESA